MKWQSALDRLVLREIDQGGGNPGRREELGELITSLIRLSPGRNESYFSLGFARGSHGVTLEAYQPDELEDEPALWFQFGHGLAHLFRPTRRRPQPSGDEESSEEGEQPEKEEAPDLKKLLEEPSIAGELLPILLRQTLAEGELEEAVRTLETVLGSGSQTEETAELLRSTLGEILRRAERPRERMETSGVLGLLHRCMALPGFDELPAEVRAPFHRTLGKLQQHVENYDEAATEFRRALEIAGEGHTLASVLHFDLAACLLRIRGVPDLKPEDDRGESEDALKHLDEATSDPKRASFNAFFTRGILRFEREMYEEGSQDFRAALERIEMYRNPLPVTLARIRYFLALSLLRGGRPEDREDAVRQLERSLERVRPDLVTLEELIPVLREHSPRTVTRVLSRMDITNAEPDQILQVGQCYRELGDAEGALKIAESALERLEDLGLRKQALLLELRCFNMLGERENARDALYDLRDLCYQSGDIDLWESVIFDDDHSGQALDRGRILSERLEVYNRRGDRQADRVELLRDIAGGYLDRAETHWRLTGLRVLKEAYRISPDEFEDDVKEAEKRVGTVPNYDASSAERAQKVLARSPTFLVLGGDEHQDRREDDLDSITSEWRLDSEWWPTDYVNPDRVVEKLRDHLTSRQPDGILLLHWNRDELIRDVRKLCRSYRITTRFVHYAGQESLREGVAELMDALATRYENSDESSAAGA